MGMLTTLRTPGNIPEWCTDESVVLEPPAENVATGWAPATRPAAPIMNWLQNLYGKWVRYFQKALLSTWQHLDYATKYTTPHAAIFHPDKGVWIIANRDGDSHCTYLASRDGQNFEVETTVDDSIFTSTVFGSTIAIDSARFLMGTTNGIHYRTDPDTWALKSNATIGATGGIKGICTEYPTYDYVVAVDYTGKVYHSTVVTGTWTAATTQPPLVPGGTLVCAKFIRVDNTSIYYLLLADDDNAKLYRSTNRGVTWNAIGYPFADSGCVARNMAYNPDTGVFVVVGYSADDTAHIEYSSNGSTWFSATKDFAGMDTITNTSLNDVYYCGNGFFVTGGMFPYAAGHGSNGMNILVSDGGYTWRMTQVRIDAEATVPDSLYCVWTFACNGNFLLAGTSAGYFITQSNGVYIEGV